jgi:xanthine dehydrogenase accessory factor
MTNERRRLVIVRGAGDLATGVMLRLYRSGYAVAALETAKPSAIRRSVCFSEAVYDGHALVEGVSASLVHEPGELEALAAIRGEHGGVPLLVDPEAETLEVLRPAALVDAIIAKRNLGTRRDMAPFVVGLGPGFSAGEDVDAVVETNRGHDLGRVIWEGPAEADTGHPGELGGASTERVIHAETEGVLLPLQEIGSRVHAGEVIAIIKTTYLDLKVYAKINGILRGMIREGYEVRPGTKIADVDPRGDPAHCHRVSDKARSIGGGVLEALLSRGILP